MMIFLNEIKSDLKVVWAKWSKGARRIWVQSKPIFLLLALSQIILGLIPFFALAWFSDFIDVLSGARGLGLWTDDLGSSMWKLVGLMLLLCVAILSTKQFSGVSASVARGIRWAVFIISVLIILLAAAPVITVLIGALLTVEIWSRGRMQHIFWIAIIILFFWLEWSLIEAIVFKVLTLGEGLAIAAFVMIIPARRFIDRYFVCE